MRDYSGTYSKESQKRDIEITEIETCVIEGNFDWNIIKIYTNVGVAGIGESYRGGKVTEIMEYMKRFLIGENPLDVERLFNRMIQEMSGHGGTTGKVVTAASGIEIALWDVTGKILDVPVYQLLGGKYRDKIRIYCDCHAGEAYETDHGYHDPAEDKVYTPEAYAEEAERVLDMGFTALKFDLDIDHHDNYPDPYNGRVSNAALDHKQKIVAKVRDTIGTSIDLAFDVHWDYTVESAKRLSRKLEPYDLLWLEDLVPPENMEAQSSVTEMVETPIATGENRFRVHEFKDLLYGNKVDIITPDPTTCGGLSETKAIANRAKENYIPVAPHNVCSPIGTMACSHLCASIPNFLLLEYHSLEVDWWDDLHNNNKDLIEDGYIHVPEKAGLGIELDEDVVENHLQDSGTMFG